MLMQILIKLTSAAENWIFYLKTKDLNISLPCEDLSAQ